MCLIGTQVVFLAPPFFVRGRVRSIKLLDDDLLTTNIYYYDTQSSYAFPRRDNR
jgi:hypothetical protein